MVRGVLNISALEPQLCVCVFSRHELRMTIELTQLIAMLKFWKICCHFCCTHHFPVPLSSLPLLFTDRRRDFFHVRFLVMNIKALTQFLWKQRTWTLLQLRLLTVTWATCSCQLVRTHYKVVATMGRCELRLCLYRRSFLHIKITSVCL